MTVLIWIAVVIAWLSAVGLVRARDFYQKVHFVGPVGTLAIPLVAMAVLAREGMNPSGGKAVLVAVISCVASALLGHALARAARVRDFAMWDPDPLHKP